MQTKIQNILYLQKEKPPYGNTGGLYETSLAYEDSKVKTIYKITNKKKAAALRHRHRG